MDFNSYYFNVLEIIKTYLYNLKHFYQYFVIPFYLYSGKTEGIEGPACEKAVK